MQDVATGTHYYLAHDVKNTTKNPIQLPTTPTAEYVLMNIRGRNSYFTPNTISCTSEQYASNGTAIAIYSNENRSSRNTRGFSDLTCNDR